MDKTYKNAINHLEFSYDFVRAVREKDPMKPKFRAARLAALAAVLILLLGTTAFGVVTALRERPGTLVEMGTAQETMHDAEILNFRVSEQMEGVTVHYMELAVGQQYSFRHGLLWKGRNYQRITENYTLEPMELKQVNAALEKNDRVYQLTFDYLDTENGIISNHRSVYQKDTNGEILLCATDGSSGQWPVYLNGETGKIRDALPDWTAKDFEGRIGYAFALKGGILITTVVEDSSDRLFYWIAPGAEEARMIDVPKYTLAHVENDTIYYQNQSGHVFGMDEKFEFHQISDYGSTDEMRDGLMTVSVRGKLGILDAFTGETFVFEDLVMQSWNVDIYHALRYSNDGTVALVKTEWRHDPERRVLTCLGILDDETGELKLLNIENDYDGYQHSWLDKNRFAVIYRSEERQFLCIYEFEK